MYDSSSICVPCQILRVILRSILRVVRTATCIASAGRFRGAHHRLLHMDVNVAHGGDIRPAADDLHGLLVHATAAADRGGCALAGYSGHSGKALKIKDFVVIRQLSFLFHIRENRPE